jgi:hypothetical protein
MPKYRAGHGIRTRDIQLGKLATDLDTAGIPDARVESDVPTEPLLARDWTPRGGKKGGKPRRFATLVFWKAEPASWSVT